MNYLFGSVDCLNNLKDQTKFKDVLILIDDIALIE